MWTHISRLRKKRQRSLSNRKGKEQLVKCDHIKEKNFIWNLRGNRSLARSLLQSAAVTSIPEGCPWEPLRASGWPQPKARRSPSTNLQASQKSHVMTSGVCTHRQVGSVAQAEAAVQSQSQALTRFLNHGAATRASPHTPGAALDHTNPSVRLTGQCCHCPQAASSTSGSPGHQGGSSRGSYTREVVHQKRCKMGLM